MRTERANKSYIPLRIHSVFSRGNGAVSPSELADKLLAKEIDILAISDPFSVVGWEKFRKAAQSRNMKFLPGIEIKLRNSDSMVMFPKNRNGYLSILSSFNRKKFSNMTDVIIIFISGQTDRIQAKQKFKRIIENQKNCDIYIGLEWNSKSWMQDLIETFNMPVVWAQPVKWIDDPEKYLVSFSVFNHYPIQDMNPAMSIKNGFISYNAVLKRWHNLGKLAMSNTFKLADKISFDFSQIRDNLINNFPGTAHDILTGKINTALNENKASEQEQKRAFRELKRTGEMAFSNYFLIAAEIADFCKVNKIYFNTRGSGASSFMLYLLGISKVNPLKYNLLFERFVNRLREALPDIDIDIESSRRPEVLKWVFKKYGTKVAFISTHKFFGARSALYEVLRSYGYSPEDAHKFGKALSPFAKPSELDGMGSGSTKSIYHQASLLDGVYKELSVHLGGVIFSNEDIEQTFPIHYSPEGYRQVIWDKDSIERLQIYKLDLLGVRGFDLISKEIQIGNIDFFNKKVWEDIRSAGTIGCFQMESPLARDALQKTKPKNLFELAIAIAIIRPGPSKSGMKELYINNNIRDRYLLRTFPNSRGAVIFEEQISVLLSGITGWSLEYSEKVRRDLKKKKGEIHKHNFIERGRNNGWSTKDLERYWKLASDFSLYAFNQAHSVSYAYSAYISAWSKTKDPVSFFIGILNAGSGYYPVSFYIIEAKKTGIKFLPPEINKSNLGFSKESGFIRTGLLFIKGIGGKAGEKIIRGKGLGYLSIEDFLTKTNLGEKDLSILIAVSTFGFLGLNKFTREQQKKNWENYLGFIPE